MLYDEYEAYVIQGKKDYGENTIVFYRCGSFFEIYSIDDGLVPIKRICDLLNIQVSKRSKAITEVNRSNTLMAGFPMYAVQKFSSILVNNKFTVVIVDQISDAPKPLRAVTMVISPGTDISNATVASDANNLMCIYLDKTAITAIGISVIDLSTGRSKVAEAYSTLQDPTRALDETYRLIQSENPREIVFIGAPMSPEVEAHLEIPTRVHVHNNGSNYEPKIENVHYQNEVLRKVFPPSESSGLMSSIEFLDLEKRPLATISFVYLMQFCYKHNELILEKICHPMCIDQDKGLKLSYNCIKHLNVIGDNGSLLSMLNRCTTAIGRRLFKDWFLNPLKEKKEIENRYDEVERMLSEKRYLKFKCHLEDIYDIERLCRRIDLDMLNPCELTQLMSSLTAAERLLSLSELSELSELQNKIRIMISRFDACIDDVEIQKYNLDNLSRSFFRPGIYADLDELQETYDKNVGFFHSLAEDMNKRTTNGIFKVDFNQVDGYHLLVTAKRYSDTKEQLWEFEFGKFKYCDVITKQTSAKSGTLKLTHDCFRCVGEQTQKTQNDLIELIKAKYLEFVREFHQSHREDIKRLITFIGQTDFYVAAAECAFNNRYFRPQIQDLNNSASYMKCDDLRHPIIEKINHNIEYVSNAVDIGMSSDAKGILLYGTNMVGKSAYMKSIGLAILMAQCGFYAPCKNMRYYPYSQLFTRMPSGDDLYKGQSTFAVEIGELRNILKRADENSLVIGDELASGTESVSAISIVASGIVQLIEKKSSFVFATHLHDLTKLQKIQELASSSMLKIFHLSVTYDEANDTLVFNRKLQPGQGHTMYGLEVCRALNIGKEFLSLANDFRRELLEVNADIVPTKTRYNALHFITKCGICGGNAEEIHHIKQQSTADEHGFIDSIHKNAKHNLVTVCGRCHDRLHNPDPKESIEVKGYVQTTSGVQLVVNKNKEVSKEIEERILHLRNQGLSVPKIHKAIGASVSIYKITKTLHSALPRQN